MNESADRFIAEPSQEANIEELKLEFASKPEEVTPKPEEAETKFEKDLKPFRESMRGAARRKEVVYGLETLKIESEKDENEFECYNNSVFSANF